MTSTAMETANNPASIQAGLGITATTISPAISNSKKIISRMGARLPDKAGRSSANTGELLDDIGNFGLIGRFGPGEIGKNHRILQVQQRCK